MKRSFDVDRSFEVNGFFVNSSYLEDVDWPKLKKTHIDANGFFIMHY